MLGFCIWTVVEYWLHGMFFHMNVKNVSPLKQTFHFVIHGLHHKVLIFIEINYF